MAKKVRTQEAVGESRCGEDPRKPPGALPRSASRKVAAAAGPTSTASREPARFGGRKRGPARPTRPTRPGPPPARGAGCSGATVAGPPCLSRRVSPKAGASCLRGTRAGVEDSRRGEDFFFPLPGLGGSRGARGRRGVVGTARSRRGGTSGTGHFPRASGRRVCVEAAGRDLPARRARPGGSRGPGLLRRAARAAGL